MCATPQVGDRRILPPEGLQRLIEALRARGYQVRGPRVRDGVIVYDEVTAVADLPAGWTDIQEAGAYRLARRADGALFGYAVGPHSWKQFLFPPRRRLWRAARADRNAVVPVEDGEAPKLALLGVRACELHAIAIQDTVMLRGPHGDPHYRATREGAFLLAVNCGQAGGTCFCASLGTGPEVRLPCDLTLTEILEGDRHYFVVDTGSALGAEILREVPHAEAGAEALRAAERVVAAAAQRMGRTLDPTGLGETLQREWNHPRWRETAARCLTCGNCTMACPTCFCFTVEDTSDLSGTHAERWRQWDSCFSLAFSYIHGGSVRATPRARYRQWMTHKLSTWTDQFGTLGCVGCGRCITWCPVGIDITEEARAICAERPPVPPAEAREADGDA